MRTLGSGAVLCAVITFISPAQLKAHELDPGANAHEKDTDEKSALSFGERLLSNLTLHVSLGQSLLINPKPRGAADATSVLFSPGYQLSPSLRTELGVLFALYSRKKAAFDMQIRASLTIAPPTWNVYARVTTGIALLVIGPANLLMGGSVGTTMQLDRHDPTTLFFEAGPLVHGDDTLRQKYRLHWIIEARVGGYYSL